VAGAALAWRARWNAAREARRLPGADLRGTPVTDLLFGRLEEREVDSVWAALSDEESQIWEQASPKDHRWVALALGVHHQIPVVIDKTGLVPAAPPEGVHAMSRGPLASGGSYGYADLMVSGLATVGKRIEAGESILDFGCSSGRVARVLAAAFPDTDWHGCDPNEAAIGWARANIPGIRFVQSPQEPPLPYEEGSFGAVFAISVWSHFDQSLGLQWLEEMHRLIRPGGALLLSTHGWHSVAHYAGNGLRTPEQLRDISRALRRDGFWYRAEFGEQGDFGIRNPAWGTAFMTADWLQSKTGSAWRIGAFASGGVEANQDLFVLIHA
jgi:SAM-dependent methyltransferase